MRRVTSCIFGGREMNTLFVTTGRQSGSSAPDGLPDGEAGGTLYAVQMRATGRPEFLSRVLI